MSALQAMTAIEAEGLTKRFGSKVLAVDRVSFSVQSGVVTGFLGPNGAGKTTTLRMVLDLVKPTSGRVQVLGRRYRDLERPATRVGALLDASGFHPGRSGRNTLRVMALAAGLPAARVDHVLELVELEADGDRAVRAYSSGMRQRLALAAALLGDPEVLVLDEPSNGLDPEGMRWLRAFLRARAVEGRAVLVSSHVLAEMEQTVDDVLIMSQGRLVAHGPMRDLIAAVRPAVRVLTPQAAELEARLRARGMRVERRDASLLVHGPRAAEVGELAHAEGFVLHGLQQERLGLEEVFLQLAGTRRDA